MGSVLRGEVLKKKKKSKEINNITKGNILDLNFTVFEEDGIIYWEFKKG